jgi:hypothetical protein
LSAHDLAGIPCPVCLKRFDTAEAVKAHQRAKRHKQFDSPDEMAMRRYHQDKLVERKGRA